MIQPDHSLRRTDAPIRMLLVEDCQHDADFISAVLTRSPEIDTEIHHVTYLKDAMEACHDNEFDIVLLDLGLPDSSGTESVTSLRDCAPDTPIVVLTGDDRYDTAMDAIRSGAQDFLPKQHVVGQLLTRMMHHSIARNQQLIQAQSEALVDGLTGLGNRRACDVWLNRRFSDFRRHGHRFSVALLDIDHFKKINDTWGHEIGDQVIHGVAQTLASKLGELDQVARYGGEEFAMILPMTELSVAESVVKRCIKAVTQLKVSDQQVKVTVSAGVTEIADHDTRRSLFERADEALYAAKDGGRNRYCSIPAGDKGRQPIVDCVSHAEVEA